jgi:hypothetical protein
MKLYADQDRSIPPMATCDDGPQTQGVLRRPEMKDLELKDLKMKDLNSRRAGG